MKFTIMGGTGFIGRNLAKHLTNKGYEVVIAPRDVKTLAGQNLGHLVYMIGLTGDTRQRPHDAIDAHVGLLSWVLQHCAFESFLYSSSTRIYAAMPPTSPVTEITPLTVIPNAESLFDVSKLLGESLCQRMQNPKVRIARLSNIYGPDQSRATFLGAVLEEIKQTGGVIIHDSPESVKDYCSIDDACVLLEQIILNGQHQVYNVASGVNVTCQSIADSITQAGYKVTFSGKNSCRLFPPISMERAKGEFGFSPRSFHNDISSLLKV